MEFPQWNDTMIQPFVHEDMARRDWGYDKFMRDFDPTQTGGFATSTFENKKVGGRKSHRDTKCVTNIGVSNWNGSWIHLGTLFDLWSAFFRWPWKIRGCPYLHVYLG